MKLRDGGDNIGGLKIPNPFCSTMLVGIGGPLT